MKSKTFLGIAVTTAMAAFTLPMSARAADGSGTANFIPRWTDSTTLGNSVLFQSNAQIGVGTTGPAARLDVVGLQGATSTDAPKVLRVVGGTGGSHASIGSAGAGGALQLMSGTGGFVTGNIPLLPALARARGGLGAVIVINGGAGARCQSFSGSCGFVGGNGGSISLQPGAGGSGQSGAGRSGNVMLAAAGGRVGIHTSDPQATLDVGPGGNTLADDWTTRSSRRFKTNIQPLEGALEKVEHLAGVSYTRKSDGMHEIGVVAEDVERVVPEVVSRDPVTQEAQGVDYSRLVALLIEAVKSQQTEIEQLKSQIERQHASTSPTN